MWAYFRVMVDSLVEKDLMSSGMAHHEVETLPREYLEAKYDTHRIKNKKQKTKNCFVSDLLPPLAAGPWRKCLRSFKHLSRR